MHRCRRATFGAATVAAIALLSACIPPPSAGPGPTTTTTTTTTAPPASLGPPAGPVELRVVGGHVAIGAVGLDLVDADLTFTGTIDVDGELLLDAAATSMTPLPVTDPVGEPLGATIELRQLSDATASLDRTTGEIGLELDVRIRVMADGTTDFPNVGQGCHIGSNANPIELRATTGTTDPPPPNLPVSGLALGAGATPAELVDNAFSVSGAVGCVLLPLNQFVNETFGVPSPAGTNSVRLVAELISQPG